MYTELQSILSSSKSIAFFGGAGVSTESGIKDFRSIDGLYHQKFAYPPETMLSHDFFFSHTREFFDFYRAKLICPQAKPNPAHTQLALWEAAGRISGVITQNIDGLHTAAGSKKVFELHGSVLRNHCVACHKAYPLQAILDTDGVPRCACGGIIKPDVVLYGEGLDDNVVSDAVHAISQADTLLVAGTSLTVYPAAGLIRYFSGSHLILINRDKTPLDHEADLVLHDPVGQVLSQIQL